MNTNKEKEMSTEIKSITINGVEYVEKSAAVAPEMVKDYRIIRTQNAGVFAGYLRSRNG